MYYSEAALHPSCDDSDSAHSMDADLVERYLPYVRMIVHRIAATLPAHVETEDLTNAGFIGLLAAVKRYDPDRAGTFTAYVCMKIRGAVLTELRSRDFMPRGLRRRFRELEKAEQAIEQRGGIFADDEAVALEMGLTIKEVQDIRRAACLSFISLEELGFDGAEDREDLRRYMFGEMEDDPLSLVGLNELQEALAASIEELSEKEKLALSLYYWEELTMKEIGLVLGITESRVSQIHSQALMKLRGKLRRKGFIEAE